MSVYFDEAKKTWYVKFRYTDWTGQSRHTTKRGFRTKRDAKAYEVDFKRSAADSPEMTVNALCEKYFSVMQGRIRESTLRQKESFCSMHVLPKIGSLPVSSVTPSVAAQWQTYLLGQVNLGTAKNGNNILNAIFNYAVKMEWIQRNPITIAGSIGKTSKRTLFWTLDEYQTFRKALIDHLGEKKGGLYAMCYDVLFFSGLRRAEFCGLGVDDIEGNIIHVRKASNRFDDMLKNDAAKRDVPMPEVIMEQVHRYIDSLPERPDKELFPFSYESLLITMRSVSKLAHVPYITLHGLRHSHVSHLISMGVPITVISKRIGHTSPAVTLKVYSHMYNEDSQGVSEQLNALLVNRWSKPSE